MAQLELFIIRTVACFILELYGYIGTFMAVHRGTELSLERRMQRPADVSVGYPYPLGIHTDRRAVKEN